MAKAQFAILFGEGAVDFGREDRAVSTAPRIDIDVAAFWHDPYPALARMRREA